MKGKLVGAAGFEPTASLLFNQGALTAELHAYIAESLSYTEGIHRIAGGPTIFVIGYGNRFHNAVAF